MPEPKPAVRKSPAVKFTLDPHHAEDLDAIGRAMGIERNRSAVVRRLIDDRRATLPRPALVVKAKDGWQVQRWTPNGMETLSTHRTQKEADAAAGNELQKDDE